MHFWWILKHLDSEYELLARSLVELGVISR